MTFGKSQTFVIWEKGMCRQKPDGQCLWLLERAAGIRVTFSVWTVHKQLVLTIVLDKNGKQHGGNLKILNMFDNLRIWMNHVQPWVSFKNVGWLLDNVG